MYQFGTTRRPNHEGLGFRYSGQVFYNYLLGYLQGRECCGTNLPLLDHIFDYLKKLMTVDGVVNVCAEKI